MIEPAFKAEEWDAARRSQAYNADVSFMRWLVSRTSHELRRPYSSAGEYSPQQIAALALFGQPFGFTREDVVALRQLGWPSHESIADRIEALLPQE